MEDFGRTGQNDPRQAPAESLAPDSRVKRMQRYMLKDFLPTLLILSAVAWVALEISKQLR